MHLESVGRTRECLVNTESGEVFAVCRTVARIPAFRHITYALMLTNDDVPIEIIPASTTTTTTAARKNGCD